MTAAPPVRITRTTRLMVATPLYAGAEADYLRSVIGLVGAAERANVGCTFAWLSNNASIDRARNVLAGAFLQSDATHLLFLDGDIGFVPEEVLDLLKRMQKDERLAVVCAPYPKRRINWPMVASASAKGMASGDAAALDRYSGVFAIEALDPAADFRMDEPLELARAGTGLMLIRRDVIAGLCERHPELRYAPDRLDRDSGITGEALHALFLPMIDEAGQLMSEDYAFCHRARGAGYRIWLAPWMRTAHTGPARFAGTLTDLAELSLTPAPA